MLKVTQSERGILQEMVAVRACAALNVTKMHNVATGYKELQRVHLIQDLSARISALHAMNPLIFPDANCCPGHPIRA